MTGRSLLSHGALAWRRSCRHACQQPPARWRPGGRARGRQKPCFRSRGRGVGAVCCQAQEPAPPDTARVAIEGDIVRLKYVCRDEDGGTVDASSEEEPVEFEVGAGEAVGNPLYQAFDGAVRGMRLGDTVSIQAQGGEWRRELLFDVPAEHPEIQRLQGRYKSQGGLRQGMLVELANGATALVARMDEATIRIDANNMMAGKLRTFELTLLSVEPQL